MSVHIVTREQWGAAPPRGVPVHVEWPAGVDFWVHHTDGPQDQTPKQIQAFHQNSRGWNDIGYGYLIDYEGVIYEGRGYEVHAAHSPGVNHQPSVALIGDYSTVPPSDAQHRSVYALRESINAGRLRGHRENTATSCPGDAAYAKIVKGPPPPPPTEFYFQRIQDGKPVSTWGPYTRKSVRDAKYLLVKCAHPTWALRTFSKEG